MRDERVQGQEANQGRGRESGATVTWLRSAQKAINTISPTKKSVLRWWKFVMRRMMEIVKED